MSQPFKSKFDIDNIIVKGIINVTVGHFIDLEKTQTTKFS